jgi:hypothetical protein
MQQAGRRDETDLAVSCTSTCRSHEVTGFSAPTATDIGELQPGPSPGVFSTLRGARMTLWGFGSIGRTLEPHLTALGASPTMPSGPEW